MKLTKEMLKAFGTIDCQLDEMQAQIRRLTDNVRSMETWLYRLFGLEHVDREPGFNCWTHKELPDWYLSPAAALSALVEKEQADEEAAKNKGASI